MRGERRWMDWESLSVCLTALLVYLNTLHHGFVYDDNRAVLTNPDVLSSSPLSGVFHSDFWGTPLSSSNSHGSYRPLCVLTFRLNHWISAFNPITFHLTNVLLHAFASALVLQTARLLLPTGQAPLLAALLFAVHPIHVEAVASVVGRADILASIFYLISFLCFVKHVKVRDSVCAVKSACNKEVLVRNKVNHKRNSIVSKDESEFSLHQTFINYLTHRSHHISLSPKDEHFYFRLFIVSSICAVLSKETGVTIIPLAISYDIILHRRSQVSSKLQRTITSTTSASLLYFSLIVFTRLYIMGLRTPQFSKADNPTAKDPSFLVRALTFSYIAAFDFFLLVCPKWLSFDWSMDSLPRITSIFDYRWVVTLLFYKIFYQTVRNVVSTTFKSSTRVHLKPKSCKTCLKDSTEDHLLACKITNNNNLPMSCDCKEKSSMTLQTNISLLMCLAFLVIPFIPASNLFFYVGFVVAERVLYIPSIGFCMLVALGAHTLWSNHKNLVLGGTLLLLSALTSHTIHRNRDWANEESLYRSGVHINPPKAWGNLGSVLSTEGRLDEAEHALRTALHFRPNMADVHYNLGNVLQRKNRHEEAVECYEAAIKYRPSLAAAYLNLGHVLESLERGKESESLYSQCCQLDVTGLKDPRNHQEAQNSCLQRLQQLCAKTNCLESTVQFINLKVLSLNSEINIKRKSPAGILTTSRSDRSAYDRQNQNKTRITQEEELFMKAISNSPEDPATFVNYGQLLVRLGKVGEAASVYVRAAELAPSQHSLVTSAAIALRQAGRLKEAEQMYRQARNLRPMDSASHSNLGAILHLQGKYREAAACYKEALRLSPQDQVTLTNLQKLRNIISRNKR